MRFKVASYIRPLPPIEWADGTDQPVKNLTWELQEILTDMAEGKADAREVMPQVMPKLLPGRSWEEIKATLDAESMQQIIVYASGKLNKAIAELGEASGNGVGATAPASPQPTPVATSSAELPAPSGAPCGTS